MGVYLRVDEQWQPWANTVLYLPLKTDLLDHWPNNITMTADGITLDSAWANFSTTGLMTWNSPSAITWDFTFSSRINPISAWDGCNIICIWEYYPYYGYRYGANLGWKLGFTLMRVIDWNDGSTLFSTLYWARHNLMLVRSWTTNTMYVDGVQFWTYYWSSTPTETNIFVGWTWIWFIEWHVNDIIIENKAWSLDERSNYYNLTKWNYWIS